MQVIFPIAAAFLVRAGLGLAMFLISAWNLPVLQAHQVTLYRVMPDLPKVGGFWDFSPQSCYAHYFGSGILNAWRTGGPFPDFSHADTEYYFFLAHLYRVVESPIIGILANAAMWALCTWFFCDLMKSMGLRSRVAAWLFAVWPSHILWSTQLLKDSAVMLFLLCALLIISRWWRAFKIGLHGAVYTGLSSLSLFIALFWVFRLRAYAGIALVLAITLAVVLQLFMRKPFLVKLTALCIAITAFAAVRYANHFSWSVEDVGRSLIVQERMLDFKLEPLPTAEGVTFLERVIFNQRQAKKDRAHSTRRWHLELTVPEWILYLTPRHVNNVRAGLVGTGGQSDILPSLRFKRELDVLAFLPTAGIIGVLAPFPAQWDPSAATTGAFRFFAGMETFVFYLFLPVIVLGAAWWWKAREMDVQVIVLFAVILAVVLGLYIPNAGTLFRLKMMWLAPAFCFLGAVIPSTEEHER